MMFYIFTLIQVSNILFSTLQYYEMSYGLNVEMHKQVRHVFINQTTFYARSVWSYLNLLSRKNQVVMNRLFLYISVKVSYPLSFAKKLNINMVLKSLSHICKYICILFFSFVMLLVSKLLCCMSYSQLATKYANQFLSEDSTFL